MKWATGGKAWATNVAQDRRLQEVGQHSGDSSLWGRKEGEMPGSGGLLLRGESGTDKDPMSEKSWGPRGAFSLGVAWKRGVIEIQLNQANL